MKLKNVATGITLTTVVTLGALVPVSALAGEPESDQTSPTVADLTMTGAGQQRWQSLPKSRIVLNPFDRDADGVQYSTSEVDQSSGPELPVAAAYYSNDVANRFPDLLSTYTTTADARVEPVTIAQTRPLSTGNGWATTGVSSTADGQNNTKVAVTDATKKYGRLTKTLSVDLSKTRYLTVKTTAVSGATWAVQINSDQKLLPNDSTLVGTNTYDLAEMTGKTGQQSVEVKIWVSGAVGSSVTFDSVALTSGEENPAFDKQVLFSDDFSANTWTTETKAATYASNGSQGIVAINTGDTATWGSVRRDVTIDVTPTTKLAINVSALTNTWALNAVVGNSGDIHLQTDTTKTGWVVLSDFASQVGTGTKTVSLRLFTSGARPSGAVFDDLVVYDDAVTSPWQTVATADDYATTWSASQETFTADYGDEGSISGRDVFTSTDSVVREIDSSDFTGDDLLLAGRIAGTAVWDGTSNLLTVSSTGYVQTYALPEDSVVRFGSTVDAANAPTPSASSAFWTADVPAGSTSRVAIAFSPVSTSSKYGTDLTKEAATAASRAEAIAAQSADLDARVSALDDQWNDYLAKVPTVDDFSLHGVPADGVTPEQTKAAYYRAFLNLEQNVIPSTPETNSLSAQLGTGKASTWMSGIPGAKNVATWDTLVGLQTLVQADPETAWESFSGIMDFVQGDDSEFPGEITNDPSKGGEVLPSRKAQTAWVLYNATGDKQQLESIYPALKRVLEFGATNLHWTVKDRGIYNYTQRDSEFVTSLIVDLGYAKKISALLGDDQDIKKWEAIENHLYDKFDDWFVRTDGVFQQKVTLASNDDNAAVTTGAGANGDSSVVAGSLVLDRLSDKARNAVLARFGVAWKGADNQFAGLSDNLKGPTINYIESGLLDNDAVPSGTEKAATFANTVVRDVVRAGWFAEVYKSAGNGTTDRPVVDGVRPSLFGIAAFIDSVWLNNGFRLSSGDATVIALSDENRGGVQGLSHLGRSFTVDLTDDGIQLTGDAVGPEAVVTLEADAGETLTVPYAHLTPAVPAVTTTAVALRTAPAPAPTLRLFAAREDADGTVAEVTVNSTDAQGAPAQGSVTLYDTSDDDAQLAVVPLDGSTASVTIPDDLAAGDHVLVARFASANTAWWQDSSSDGITLTVAPSDNGNGNDNGNGAGNGGGSTANGSASTDGDPDASGSGLPATGGTAPIAAGLLAVALLGAGWLSLIASRRIRVIGRPEEEN